jgi:hypothetical protein
MRHQLESQLDIEVQVCHFFNAITVDSTPLAHSGNFLQTAILCRLHG